MQLDNVIFTSHQLNQALLACPEPVSLQFDISHVSDITLDSRRTNLHTAFVALKGSQSDGFDFIESALGNNCKLIFCEKPPSDALLALAIKAEANIVVLANLKDALASMLAVLFEDEVEEQYTAEPEQNDIAITAVTGTNGKTSVAALYAQLSLALGTKSASLGTTGLNIYSASKAGTGGSFQTAHIDVGVNTTPDIISHYKVKALLRQHQVARYCLEASSHGIEQGRLQGLPIQTAIFTNLSQDHLDYHGSMEAYAAAKRGLLLAQNIRHLVLNAHDNESKVWQASAAGAGIANVAWFALGKADIPADAKHFVYAENIVSNAKGFSFTLCSSWGEANVQLGLLGRFNILNFLAATTAHLMQGASLDALLAHARLLQGVPGRMELFSHGPSQYGNFIVDYAHTPDALEQALKAAREHTKGRLYCVFGCGGNRDKSKRALMGQIAAKYSDAITLTQDNSRSESPQKIIQDIQQGIDSDGAVQVVLDRKEAVRTTWLSSAQNDLILLAGKGHEDYLEINHQRLPYSEREYVQALCAEAVA